MDRWVISRRCRLETGKTLKGERNLPHQATFTCVSIKYIYTQEEYIYIREKQLAQTQHQSLVKGEALSVQLSNGNPYLFLDHFLYPRSIPLRPFLYIALQICFIHFLCYFLIYPHYFLLISSQHFSYQLFLHPFDLLVRILKHDNDFHLENRSVRADSGVLLNQGFLFTSKQDRSRG